MGSDRARISYDQTQKYRAVVAQQGRVTLEADLNEAQQIASEELREETLDFVGASGTPDNGYEVISAAQPFDFATRAGTMYVGGVRAFSTKAIEYSNQLDWLDRVGDPLWVDLNEFANALSAQELVYLLLREQEVSAVEDSALLEKALGGPDTTQRLRLIQHIVRLQTKGENCSWALDEAIEIWRAKQGLELDRSTLQLLSSATLKVSFSPPTTPADLCEPEARSGYLGAENQLIRVQISGTNQLVWGFDNAAFLYRAEVVSNQILRLKSRPVDDFHRPRANQAVEILRSAAQLNNQEYIAAATGLVTTLTAPYNPDTREVSLAAGLSTEYLDQKETPRLFLRVWEEAIPFTPGVAVTLGQTGLQVTLQTINNQPFHIGDYWQIAVRPGEPTEVYPPRYLEAPQPPNGPRLWACPLAVIGWKDRRLSVIEDCRHPFDSLVDLTRRNQGGCCTVTVRPEDLTPERTLQSILDRFASRNRPNRDHITICLMPGIYQLPQSLQLGPQHSNFTLQGCGDGAELQAAPGKEVNFLHGLIVLNRANYVTLRNLRFQLPIVPFVKAGGILTPFPGSRRPEISRGEQLNFGERFQKTLRVSIGIRPLHCALLAVENCLFRFAIEKTINLFAVGIFAGSECWELQLVNNRFLRDEEYLITQEKTTENEQRFLLGYLLSPSLIPTKEPRQFNIVPSLLQDAVIRDNRFTGLTTAMLILADTGMVRLESNTVLQCISGFLLTPIELGELLGANIETALLGFLFPLPESFDERELAQKYEENVQNIPGIDRLSLSLHASANDIDTQVTEGAQVLSGPGLVVAGNKRQNPDRRRERGNRDRLTTSSVLLTANKFRNHIPTENKNNFLGTVSISDVERCTVTGNLILNESPGEAAISLVMSKISASSVTGNIFHGRPQPPLPDLLNTTIIS
ncbi:MULTISPECIES: DUF6519 domain-containing protein [unclassified Microcoleus]|uniref:DUF6519 domain-containing protein n=1 Tax=unclassified Microcoleus TaxID=2642155 RepID=UPI002FD3C708